jgi:hypothetical protein
VEEESRRPIVIIRLACGCVGTGEAEEVPPEVEPGEEMPCPNHDGATAAIALVAWVGPEEELPCDVLDWGPYIHMTVVPDYWMDFGVPGLSAAPDGRVTIDVGDEKGHRLLRKGERDLRTN